MKYYRAIITLLGASLVAVVMLLYFGNITSSMQKQNTKLIKKIKFLEEQININEIEYSIYNGYDYLKKMQKIYLTDNIDDQLIRRISYKDLENKDLGNFYNVGINNFKWK